METWRVATLSLVKYKSSEVLASLCVAYCFCKHMNKNKNGQENGIYLAHAYSNGGREAVLTLLYLARVSNNDPWCVCACV